MGIWLIRFDDGSIETMIGGNLSDIIKSYDIDHIVELEKITDYNELKLYEYLINK